jgi:hypothetical protein
MLLQTNSYIVPREKRADHSRLLARFRQTLLRLGCDSFEVYEQVGSSWTGDTTGRYVQLMRFRDKKQQQMVQEAERTDPAAQQLIKEFCELINFPYQQEHGIFAVGFYNSVLPQGPAPTPAPVVEPSTSGDRVASDTDIAEALGVQSAPGEPGGPANT